MRGRIHEDNRILENKRTKGNEPRTMWGAPKRYGSGIGSGVVALRDLPMSELVTSLGA